MNLYTLLLVFTFWDLLCAGCCKELISPARWCSKWRSSDAQMTGLHTWHKSYKKCLLLVDKTCCAANTELKHLATLFEVSKPCAIGISFVGKECLQLLQYHQMVLTTILLS